jgi:hypothetical protein
VALPAAGNADSTRTRRHLNTQHVVASRVPPPKLTRPLPIKGGPVLRIIGCTANYMLELPRAESCNRWRHAARLLLAQADVAAISRQFHLALFYDTQLDIGAMD